MAESRLPQRIDYPSPSVGSGVLYDYLLRMAVAVNSIPAFSFTSGNPNSVISGTIGSLACNIGVSANTARLWVKEYGSSNTGWSSVATA